jgi:hypothetical protein
MTRHTWIATFVGHALLRELADDPEWIFDEAEELYYEMRDIDPRLAAESAFCPRPRLQ